ncbi:MAG TPA: hypothetical protein VH302_04115 [Bryobacteraceae bacterium]|jgi:hypothetical protein|nr:hypothetical protein [Bryobacteraceae bacterium]
MRLQPAAYAVPQFTISWKKDENAADFVFESENCRLPVPVVAK